MTPPAESSPSQDSQTLRQSPLQSVHAAVGATFTDFAGWQMPVRYSSDLAEHRAVRTAAGLFDLSHMAEFLIAGPGAADFLDYALAGRISATEIGQAKYSLLLTEAGGIIDDLVVYRLSDERFMIVANASNREPVARALTERSAHHEATVDDLSESVALIAVQGPSSQEILRRLADADRLRIRSDGLTDLKYYRSLDAEFDGAPALIARTGYTGEDGFELYVGADHATKLWNALADAGDDLGLIPCGLASRDTLRLEAGMPLYGHELGMDTFPAQAGLGRVVNLKKDADFVGRAASEAGPPDGSPVLVGLAGDGKRAARSGYQIFAPSTGTPSAGRDPGDKTGGAIGRITSGALSPTLAHPIAMAYVQPAFAEPGTRLNVDVRGTDVGFTVTSLPFYSRKKN